MSGFALLLSKISWAIWPFESRNAEADEKATAVRRATSLYSGDEADAAVLCPPAESDLREREPLPGG
jgi:hypothetical protein